MSDIVIYHNPRCTKSRQTLALLDEKGITPKVVEYLKDVPSETVLSNIYDALGEAASELVRVKESVYKEVGLSKEVDRNTLLKALVENPILIERPIVVNGSKAAIGRPPERVLAIL